MDFQIIIHFKNGDSFTTDVKSTDTIDGNFLKTIITGKLNNANITLNDTVARKYDEVRSFEIKFLD